MSKRLIVWLIVLALLMGVTPTVFAQTAYNLGPGVGVPNTWTAIQTFSAGLTVSGGNLIAPTLIGGTNTASTLTLQSTSGVGVTGADIIFKVGNNGATEAGRFLNNGNFGIGGATNPSYLFSLGSISKGFVEYNSGIQLKFVNTGSGAASLGVQNLHATGFSGIEYIDSNGVTSVFTGFNNDGSGEFRFNNVVSNGYISFKIASQIKAVIANNGRMGLGGTATPVALLDLSGGDLAFSGANGQKYVQSHATELVAVGSGITTKATTIQIPADAIVYAVPVLVKTQPGGTANFTVTATTSGTAFQKGVNISTAAGTTDPGTKNTPVNYNAVAAQTITFTFNAATTDALGQIRVDIYYATSTPPTN